VPMLVRWPGVAQPGQIRSENVSLVDVMPTLLAATGIKAPDHLAGAALQPLLRGEPAKDWREFLFTEENFHEPQMFHGQRSVRDGRYKLLLNLVTFQPHSEVRSDPVTREWWVDVGLPAPGQSPVELFDLQTDPDETKNLADNPAHAATRRRLESALQRLREKDEADPLLDPARVQRWKDAATRWGKLPRVMSGHNKVVRIPAGELELLK
jgi:arylsulfatase A-like enzyme